MSINIEFTVPGIPRPRGSKRQVGKGRMIEVSKLVANWRSLVSLQAYAEMVGKDVIRKPHVVAIRAEFFFDRPKSHYTTTGLRATAVNGHTGRPDVDKLLRALLDGMTGIVFEDDSQVRIDCAAKYYGKIAETKVHVTA